MALKRAVLSRCRAKTKQEEGALGFLFGLLGQEHGLDVGQNSSLGDGDAGQELVQLFVVADGQLQVTGDDTGLLVVTCGVAGQLENFSGQILHDGGQVDGSAGSDALGVVALAQETVDSSDGELESGTGRASLGLGFCFASFASA